MKKDKIMSVVVKKKDRIETKTLYVRGVTIENAKFFNTEAKRLGYETLGDYFNELARTMRKELIDAGRDPVRYKSRSTAKKNK